MPEETDRLDSWKQIAAYLQKSERTVRRWHETEGLPVHKHQHQQRGSVFTYASEIDDWLEQQPVPPHRLTDELELIETPSQRPRWMWLGTLGAALAACGGAFVVSQRFVGSPSRQATTSRRAHLAAGRGVRSRLFPRTPSRSPSSGLGQGEKHRE